MKVIPNKIKNQARINDNKIKAKIPFLNNSFNPEINPIISVLMI